MAEMAMILANTGQGKSYSIRGLDPKTTFIISPFKMALPWKGWKKDYTEFIPKKQKGNMYRAKGFLDTIQLLKTIGSGKLYNTVIIDDLQFLTGFKAIEEGEVGGFSKFIKTAEYLISLFSVAETLRDDLTIFFLSHVEVDEMGTVRARIGSKFVAETSNSIEAFFNIVLGARLNAELDMSDDMYGYLQTRKEGLDTLRAPFEMFETERIPNDLELVRQAIIKFNEGE